MACLCKNPDGTFAQNCNGTCSQKSFKECDAVQQRSEKTIEDRVEYILSMFLNKVDDKLIMFESEIHEQYKHGFKDGFEFGRDIYE